jgi:hypothetical protein
LIDLLLNAHMQRRTFIKIVGIAGTAGLPISGCEGAATIDEVLRLPYFLSGVSDIAALQSIGRKFGKSFPEQYDAVKLGQQQPISDPSVLASLLADKTTRDFNTGDTIVLEGWVLSLTEARQCALFSLVQTQ